jgi:hypothetical protein
MFVCVRSRTRIQLLWNRPLRVAEIVVRDLEKDKPPSGDPYTREFWSVKGQTQVRPGHMWLLKFGKVAGSNSFVEKVFKVGTHKYEEYKGVRFGDGGGILVVDVYFYVCRMSS